MFHSGGGGDKGSFSTCKQNFSFSGNSWDFKCFLRAPLFCSQPTHRTGCASTALELSVKQENEKLPGPSQLSPPQQEYTQLKLARKNPKEQQSNISCHSCSHFTLCISANLKKALSKNIPSLKRQRTLLKKSNIPNIEVPNNSTGNC